MKQIQYLSPTSLSLFQKSRDEFYLNYLSDNRPERVPQTAAMAVGSSFDAHVKNYLYSKLFGKVEPKYELTTLFEAQVSAHNRTEALKAGQMLFKSYQQSAALADLMLELQSAASEPKFEIEVKGVINGFREGVTSPIGGVTFLGKPDVFFINRHGAHVILDWKVNGYYSDKVSPMTGYVRMREVDNDRVMNHGNHKSSLLMVVNGITVNINHTLDGLNKDWAQQLSIYSWLCGEEIGANFIAAIDQICCKPTFRIAEHRLKINSNFQFAVFAKAQEAWEIIHSDHYFRHMTKEESQQRCLTLDGMAAALEIKDDNDKWFNSITRGL